MRRPRKILYTTICVHGWHPDRLPHEGINAVSYSYALVTYHLGYIIFNPNPWKPYDILLGWRCLSLIHAVGPYICLRYHMHRSILLRNNNKKKIPWYILYALRELYHSFYTCYGSIVQNMKLQGTMHLEYLIWCCTCFD